ncbi:MAG TPA: hypothetical protein VM694_19425 [Polyangium sp.]|nr:hypothetical protein [Polyangium sp.]
MQSHVVFAAVVAAFFVAGCTGGVVVEAETDAGASGSGGGGGAPLVDAGVEDAASDAGTIEAGPSPLCPMDGVVTAAVTGTTPLGAIDLPYGWMGTLNAECGGIHVVLSAASSFDPSFGTKPSSPSLAFGRTMFLPMTGLLGAAEANVEVEVEGAFASAKGWLDITRTDPMPDGPVGEGMEYPRTEGTISIQGPGWDVSGSFTALYCNWMDVYCP